MKPPPLLLGATLLFWGWQAEFLAVAAVLAVILESAIFLKVRWEFSDEDFRRLWTFCSVLLLAALVFAFTENEGPMAFGDFFNQPSPRTQGAAGMSSARTAAAMFRWLPMILFPFIAAHNFSTREAIPLTAISWILRRRQLKAKQAGRVPPPDRFFHPGFPYFAACVVGASVHPAENARFYWGLGALLAWALWSQRSRRFSLVVWAMTLMIAGLLGYFGQQGMWQVQRQLQNLNIQLLLRLRYGRP
jgi:protein-glutamine gamma-glutamyltransferase